MTDEAREHRARMGAQRVADRERSAQERTLTDAPRFGDDILAAEQANIDRLAGLAEQVGRNSLPENLGASAGVEPAQTLGPSCGFSL